MDPTAVPLDLRAGPALLLTGTFVTRMTQGSITEEIGLAMDSKHASSLLTESIAGDPLHRPAGTGQPRAPASGPGDEADIIWRKLKDRAEQISYGTLVCEMQVHQGRIRQVDITLIKERMRAD